jgi:geranylgeranyl diphosphate synthase type I
MIARKSAALLSCSTAAGAILADAPPEWVTALTQYGHQLGMGFQIRDDILGIWGHSETTGKPAGDLYRKKKTLPSLYALSRDRGDAAGAAGALVSLFGREAPDDGDVARALQALDHSGARRHCESIVRRYCSGAREHLRVLPPSPARDALTALTFQMETRDA